MNGLRFRMPSGVVSAVERGAANARRQGFPDMQVSVVDGKVVNMSLFDRDGRQHYVVRDELGGWLEHVNVGG